MKFSLVLATLGRTNELANFLVHLNCQSYRNFELIVVDQNHDDRLIPILAPYSSYFQIKHLRAARGLSHARNIGLQHVSGDVVAFPDDDCWYQPQVLERVATNLDARPDWDGLTGRWNTRQARSSNRHRAEFLNRFNVWLRTCSILIFLRSSAVAAAGDFDELLGCGSSSGFGGGEETDYLLRAIEKNCRIWYEPSLLIDHPQNVPPYDDQAIRKAYSYARGVGYTIRKHHYPLWHLSYFLLRHVFGATISLVKGDFPRARFYWALLRGRLSGWVSGSGYVQKTEDSFRDNLQQGRKKARTI